LSKHILVLGGSGFLGKAVIKELTNRGHRITGLYRKTPLPEGVTSVQADIRSFQWSRLNNDLPDIIVHLARIPGRRKLSRFIAGLQGKRASHRLIRWMQTLPQAPHMVYVSGTLVYGDRDGRNVTENSPLSPIAFQRDYIKAEYPFLDELSKNKLPVSIVRPPWIIGPGSWFSQFYYYPAKKTGQVTQFGDGTNLMSLIHVSDCASQIADVATQEELNQIYNLYSCPPVTHEEFIKLVAQQTGAEIKKMSSSDLRKKFGKTVWEALTFSMHVTSTKDLIIDHPNKLADPENAVSMAVQELENKQ